MLLFFGRRMCVDIWFSKGIEYMVRLLQSL